MRHFNHTAIALCIVFNLLYSNALAFSQEASNSAFFQAASSNNAAVVKEALASGQSPDALDSQGKTALMLAAEAGATDVLSALLSNQASINLAQSETQMTALHYAAQSGQLAAVQLLLSLGANADLRDANRNTPADLAQSRRHSDVARYLQSSSQPYYSRDSEMSSNRVTAESSPEYTLALAVLTDPNSVTQAISLQPELLEATAKVSKTGSSEKTAWASRRATSYRQVISALQRQLTSEFNLITEYAKNEDANETQTSTALALAKWNERFDLVSADMRRLRREELMGQQQTQRVTRRRGNAAYQEAPIEESQTPSYDTSPWLSQSRDNRETLSSAVNDELMTDFGAILSIADREKAGKTILVVKSIIISRGLRQRELQEAFDRNSERESNMMQNGNTRGAPRRGRSMPAEQPMNQRRR